MLFAKQYMYPKYGKTIKSRSELTKHLNLYIKEVS